MIRAFIILTFTIYFLLSIKT